MNAAVRCTCELIRGVNVLPHHTPIYYFTFFLTFTFFTSFTFILMDCKSYGLVLIRVKRKL